MGESVLTEFKSMRRTLWFFRRNKENRRTLTFLSFFPNESHGLQFFDYGQDLVRAYSAWACPCKNGGKSVSKHLTDGFSCSCWRHLQIECQHGLNWNLGLSLSLRSGLSVRLSRHPVSQSFVPPVGLVLLFFTSNYCCCSCSNQTADELSTSTELTPEPFCHLKCGQSDQPPDQGSSFARHSLNSSSTHAILRRVVQCMQKFRRCTNQITYRVQLLYNSSPSSRRNSFQSPSVLA